MISFLFYSRLALCLIGWPINNVRPTFNARPFIILFWGSIILSLSPVVYLGENRYFYLCWGNVFAEFKRIDF